MKRAEAFPQFTATLWLQNNQTPFWECESFGAKRQAFAQTHHYKRCLPALPLWAENRPVRVNLECAGEKRSGAVRDAPVMGGRREWEAVRVRADLGPYRAQTTPIGMEAGKDGSSGILLGLAAQQFTDIFFNYLLPE